MGRGPHLCFLHGFCEDSSIWSSLIHSLKKDFTCIAIDLPGFGASSALNFQPIAIVAKQVNGLLKHEKVKNVVMLGHSMGGYILANYINKFGSVLRGAAFVHSTSRADSKTKVINRTKTINFLNSQGTKEFFPLFTNGLVAPRNVNKHYKDLFDLVQKTKDSSVVNGLIYMRERDDEAEVLKAFDKPVLFLIGNEDVHYAKSEILVQASFCSLAQISVLKEVGHLSMVEDKKKCLTEVRHFLNFIEKTAIS